MFINNLKHDLTIGQPVNSLIPEESTKIAIDHTMSRKEKDYVYRYLNYGEVQGDQLVREEIAKWQSRQINSFVDPKNIYITNGCSHGIQLVSSFLIKPGDNILVEGPSYFLASSIFLQSHLNCHFILKDEKDDFDLELLEKTIKEKNIKAFYLVTNYHNPTGKNLPLKQRTEIYRLAHKYEFYVISDDIYEHFYFDSKTRTVPLYYCDDKVANGDRSHLNDFQNDDTKYVVSINSFNKLLCPGFRVGFIQAHSSVIKTMNSVAYVFSSGGNNNFMSHVTRSFLELGLADKQIDRTRDEFISRVGLVNNVLKDCKIVDYDIPEGGYFFFLRLREKINRDKLISLMEQRDLKVVFGENCVAPNARALPEFQYLRERIRISFAFLPIDDLLQGCKLLIQSLEESLA